MEEADRILARRLEIWNWYYERTGTLERAGRLRRPIVPEHTSHNAHMFYVLLSDRATRDGAISALAAEGVNAVFHYVPLHSSPAGERFARVSGSMTHTEAAGDRLLRLPLWLGMEQVDVDRVAGVLERYLG
jgi:dTDP-4-amino-4,6-dideoxygalactose transaminase